MGRHETMIAIGVGCRKGCPADDIVALVREALAALPAGKVPAGLFSIADKRGEPGLTEAAAVLGLPLSFLETPELQQVAGAAKTHSRRIEAMHGLPSVAETAALAGAGRARCCWSRVSARPARHARLPASGVALYASSSHFDMTWYGILAKPSRS